MVTWTVLAPAGFTFAAVPILAREREVHEIRADGRPLVDHVGPVQQLALCDRRELQQARCLMLPGGGRCEPGASSSHGAARAQSA
jgi:hypothetical protein